MPASARFFAVRPPRLTLAVALIALAAGAGAWVVHRPPDPVLVPRAPATAPPVRVSALPRETVGATVGHYRGGGADVVMDALRTSARALRESRYDVAEAALTSGAVTAETDVIVERYRAGRLDGAPGSIDHTTATRTTAALFDLSYAIGQPGRRGVRVGELALGPPAIQAKLFASRPDYVSFQVTRVLSLMEPWIRVLQDMRGVRPLSERTRRYIREIGRTAGWSNIDVLAVFHDLDVPLPPALASDPRFPEWPSFTAWSREVGLL